MKDIARTILLAEDNDDDAFLTTRAIGEAGIAHRIEHCRDGRAVLHCLQTSLSAASSGEENPFPDLVLLDLKLPRLNGFETLRWIRSQDTLRSLTVLALTSSTEPRDVAAAYQLHINAYLVKPASLYEMTHLARSIRDFWLDQKHYVPPPLGIFPSESTRLP
jgi:CheY-like chemotaxis protein